MSSNTIEPIAGIESTETDEIVEIEVRVTTTVFVTVPKKYADEVTAFDFEDEISYMVSELAEDVMGRTVSTTILTWDEFGVEETGEAEVEASIIGIAY